MFVKRSGGKRGKILTRVLGIGLALATLGTFATAHAADAPTGDFSLQVTPSPLVTTVKPGTKTQLELKIHNGGTGTEDLKIEPRSFSLGKNSTSIELHDTAPPGIADWISFSAPKFTAQSGQWVTQHITLNIPKDAGFSYSFALVISRQADPKPTNGGRLIKGSLAIFTLVNIDRPGATSSLKITDFTASKRVYEYLPTEFSVHFRNNGNTIVQPYGNIFVQRGADSKSPYGTLNVNETKGYILPGTERTITASWSDGFPTYKTQANPDGTTSQKLVWDWAKLSQLRIGRYTAHLVAVYNQAGRDIPIEGDVTFWVIPWKILLVLLTIGLLVLFALFMIVQITIKSIGRGHAKRTDRKVSKQQTPSTDGPDSSQD